MGIPRVGEKFISLSSTTYNCCCLLTTPFRRKELPSELSALMGSPSPRPRIVISFTFFNWMESWPERLNKIGLLTPESRMKESFAPLTSRGITIRLLISSKRIRSDSFPAANWKVCVFPVTGKQRMNSTIYFNKDRNLLTIKLLLIKCSKKNHAAFS